MSFASRNNVTAFNYDFDTSDFEYKKCKDLDGNKIYKVYGYFSSVGMYGKQYTLVTDKFFLNLPKYMTEQLNRFNEEDIKDIKDGKVGVQRKDYKTKQGQVAVSITWVDIT